MTPAAFGYLAAGVVIGGTLYLMWALYLKPRPHNARYRIQAHVGGKGPAKTYYVYRSLDTHWSPHPSFWSPSYEACERWIKRAIELEEPV